MNKTIYPLILAALLIAVLHAPSQAQGSTAGGNGVATPTFLPTATNALPSFLRGTTTTLGSALTGSSGAAMSGGATGVFGNTSSLTGAGPMGMGGLTSNLTSQQTPFSSLPQASYNLMAPNSVNMSPFPSAQWTYGFPNEATAPFMGVDHGSVGGFLPATSTSSVNLNTVDCPFIRMPTEGNGVGASPGGSGSLGNLNFNINLPGGVNVNGSVNTQQAINGLQNYFGN